MLVSVRDRPTARHAARHLRAFASAMWLIRFDGAGNIRGLHQGSVENCLGKSKIAVTLRTLCRTPVARPDQRDTKQPK